MNKGKLMLHAHVEYTNVSWEMLRGPNCMWQVSSVSSCINESCLDAVVMKEIYNLCQMEKTPLVLCLLYKNSFLCGSYLLQLGTYAIDKA